jgi:hypothetical protein
MSLGSIISRAAPSSAGIALSCLPPWPSAGSKTGAAGPGARLLSAPHRGAPRSRTSFIAHFVVTRRDYLRATQKLAEIGLVRSVRRPVRAEELSRVKTRLLTRE